MIPAPRPSNESVRLRALREYRILDTAPEQVFDDFTFLAAQVCDVPIATISFVDEDRQWFKSVQGLNVRETPRDHAFCAHTILDASVMIVPDATLDPRFRDNPLVTEAPQIRFYAGAPLITPGRHVVGTLCAIDRAPRELTADQQAALAALARQVVSQLELRRVAGQLADALATVTELEGLLPICANCKSIRDDQGYWNRVESYFQKRTGTQFTHSICPTCFRKLYPDFGYLHGLDTSATDVGPMQSPAV